MNRSLKLGGIMTTGLLLAAAGLAVTALLRQAELGHRLDILEKNAAALRTTVNEGQSVQDTMAESVRALEKRQRTVRSNLRDLEIMLDERWDELEERVTDRSQERTAGMRRRLDVLEAFWAEKGELLPAIPGERLNSGYTLAWEGGEALPLEAVGGVLMLPGNVGVALTDGACLRSSGPATPLSTVLSEAGNFSLAVSLKAANLQQGGPARIVSISRDPGYRNVTLGQQADKLVVRVRTTTAGENGTDPELVSDGAAVTGDRQRIVFVRRQGTHRLYVDGDLVTSLDVGGDLSNWDHSLPLLIGNELGGDRRWEGEIYDVTFYNRALTGEEVTGSVARADDEETVPAEDM